MTAVPDEVLRAVDSGVLAAINVSGGQGGEASSWLMPPGRKMLPGIAGIALERPDGER